MLHFVVVK